MKKGYILILLGVLLGCSKLPIKQPRTIAPSGWKPNLCAPMQACSTKGFCWWKRLRDPVLNNLMRQAFAKNYDLLISKELKGFDLRPTSVEVSAEVAKTYIKVRAFQIRLGVIDKNIENQKETVKLTKELITSGLASSLDEAQAEEQLSQLLAQKPLLLAALNQAINHLTTLLGSLPGELCLCLQSPAPLPSLPCPIPIGCPAEILGKHPSIIRASVGLPSCNNKSRRGEYVYKKVVLEAFEEAENSITDLCLAIERLRDLTQAYNQAQDAYQQMHQLYERGLKDYLNLLVTYRSLLSTEDELIQAKVEVLDNYIDLYKALGS